MIHIEKLCKRYGDFEALRDLSLDVPPGEIFCFLGPNGAGKTTTMKILTGLLRPTSGSATINGRDIQKAPIEVKQMIGYIPDMPFLYERLTTTEFFRFTGMLYRIPEHDIRRKHEELFTLFGLNDHAAALVKDLSHGLRQRLTYASVLMHDPTVLFIDEPLIGLDPHTIRLIKDLLREKARAGMTIFLTTHILALAEDIADRIGIILHGELKTVGTLAELRARHGVTGTLEDLFLHLTDGQPGASS